MTILVVNNYKNQKKYKDRIQQLRNAMKKAGESEVYELPYSEVGKGELPRKLEAVILSGSETYLNKDLDLYRTDLRTKVYLETTAFRKMFFLVQQSRRTAITFIMEYQMRVCLAEI